MTDSTDNNMPPRRTVAVVGATGFIGRHLCRAYAQRGWQVVAVSRAASSHGQWPPDFDCHDNVRVVTLDVHRFNGNPMEALGAPDVLMHLAWPGLPNYADAFHYTENLPAARNFLKACLDGGLRHLVVAGTCLEYGMREGECSEEHTADPALAYSRAKNELRVELQALTAASGCVFQWLRLFYMSGPGQNPRSLLAQLDAAIERGDARFPMSMGDQRRDYLSVETVAEMMARISEQTQVQGVLNCCSGDPTTVLELVEARLRKHRCTMELDRGRYPVPNHEPHAFWGSTAKLRQAIGALTGLTS